MPALGHKEIFRGNNRGVGGVGELGPGRQNRSCATTAHKAGELALIWAGGQSGPGRDGGGREGRRGNAGTRLTEAFMSEGASADKKTQGPAVWLCKDGGELCHLGSSSPGNGSHP